MLLAAGLRLTGLGWGLRHTPHMDERYFVESVWRMLASGDLDHRYYEYPGLFFYLLAPALALVKTAAAEPGAAAYLAARAVVALFGTLNVALLAVWGSRRAGATAALAAAALLAVSPVDVQTAHMVRSDPVLQTFVLLALMALAGVGDRARGDLGAGAALGAASAVKFTGLLLLPSYLLRRLLAPGNPLRGAALAALAAGVAFALLSPYALLHAGAFLEGASTQVGYHYEPPQQRSSAGLGMALAYASVWPKALGWAGAALAGAGAILALREAWRTWLPLLALPLVTLAAFGTQHYRFDRHMLPSLPILALCSGLAVAAVARRSRAGALLLAVGAALAPLSASVAYLRAITVPGTRDVALDWIQAQVPEGARVLNVGEGVGVDPQRYEVLWLRRLRGRALLQALAADVVVTARPGDDSLLRQLPVAFVARPANAYSGPAVRVRRIGAKERPPRSAVPLAAARLSASQNAEALPLLHDGRLDTRWELAPRRGREEWIQVDLDQPVRVARVELELGEEPDAAGRSLQIAVSRDGRRWTRLRPLLGRPPLVRQLGTKSQLLLLEPTLARALRILQRGRPGPRWAVAELRIEGLADSVAAR